MIEGKTLGILMITLAIIGMLIGIIAGAIEYDYSINKCNNLNSDQSNYDFDYKIETNANFNSNCYYLANHPLAFANKLIFGGILGALLLCMVVMMIIAFFGMLSDPYMAGRI